MSIHLAKKYLFSLISAETDLDGMAQACIEIIEIFFKRYFYKENIVYSENISLPFGANSR